MIQKCDMQKIIDFIQSIYNTKDFIPLHEPKLLGNEKKYLNDCIDSTFVSSVGKYVDKLENEFAKKVGSKYAIATVNGTSSLHIALLLANVTKEDEVITQPLTFVATCNAIAYINAKPIFVDVDIDTMGMSPKSLKSFLMKNCQVIDNKCINIKTQRVIKACLPMHTFGHPCKIDQIKDICNYWRINLVEDSAESLGSYYKEQHTGTFGKLGVFSFNGNKIITAGGGGMIVTNDQALAARAKHLTTTAKVAHPYEYNHDEIGFNYRMPNLNAALLLAQLEQLDTFINNKKDLSKIYQEFFKTIPDFEFVEFSQNLNVNHWLQAVRCKNKQQRDAFLKLSNEQGVMTRPLWKLMNELEMFKDAQCSSLKNSKLLEESIVNIPSSVRN